MHIRRQLAVMTQVSLPPSLSRSRLSLFLLCARALSRRGACGAEVAARVLGGRKKKLIF